MNHEVLNFNNSSYVVVTEAVPLQKRKRECLDDDVPITSVPVLSTNQLVDEKTKIKLKQNSTSASQTPKLVKVVKLRPVNVVPIDYIESSETGFITPKAITYEIESKGRKQQQYLATKKAQPGQLLLKPFPVTSNVNTVSKHGAISGNSPPTIMSYNLNLPKIRVIPLKNLKDGDNRQLGVLMNTNHMAGTSRLTRITIKTQMIAQPQKTPQNIQTTLTKESCYIFLSTLIEKSRFESRLIQKCVRNLIQQLVFEELNPEQFCERFETLTHSSKCPNVVHFLEETLPSLRHSLLLEEFVIDGIKPPNKHQ